MVEGIAYFEKDIGVDPLAAHDFVEVFASVADLMRQPGDASSLPRKLRLDGLSDVKAVGSGLFMVHFSVPLGATVLIPIGQQKRRSPFHFCSFDFKALVNL